MSAFSKGRPARRWTSTDRSRARLATPLAQALEPLESRELLTTGWAELATLAPFQAGPVAAATVQATARPTLADAQSQLRAVALAVLTVDSVPQAFYTRTARALAAGQIGPANAYLQLLRTPQARQIMTQGLSQALYHQAPTASSLQPDNRRAGAGAGMRQQLYVMATETSFYQHVGGNPERYRAALAQTLLGATSLPGRLASAPVATLAQRRNLVHALMQTSEFRSTWVQQLARVASNTRTFSAAQLAQAARGFQGALGFETTLAKLLTYPVSRADVARRVDPPALRSGRPINNPWATNRQWLVPERASVTPPATDVAARTVSGLRAATTTASTTTTTTSLSNPDLVIPTDSNWGDRLAFPGVSYDAIMAATQANPATVPTLSLPTEVLSDASLTNGGVSFTLWVQPQGPGMLLAGSYRVGTSSNLTVPYVWINANGQVVAGLYGPGGIDAIANETILSSTGPLGNTAIGSPLAITSQNSIIDNTWHHVAFVANATQQALYVDGLLQGVANASYLQDATGLTSAGASKTITVTLDQTPVSGSTFNTQVFQNGGPTYRLSGTVAASGSVALTVTAAASPPGSYTTVSGATLNGTTLTLTMANQVNSADELALTASYQTSATAFSLTPTFVSGSSTTLGALQSVNTGGSIFSLETANLAPQTNYPEPFVGAIDELGLWSNDALSQAEIQAVMTVPTHLNLNQPVTLPSGKSIPKAAAPTYYFSFDHASNHTFTSQSPATNTTATATASGLIVGVASTIPTDPFATAKRLPGFQDFGIGLMTPLATGALDLGSGATTVQFALAVSDQLKLSVPAASLGTLTVTLQDDLGSSSTTTLQAGQSYYIKASRTGSYEMQLSWNPSVPGTQLNLSYDMIPGALNSLPELFTSYQPDPSKPSSIVYAYADPTLPTLNPNSNNAVGYARATGPASYFPLWSDPLSFPSTTNYTAADLSQAYSQLVANLVSQNTGLTDFANINGGGAVDNPGDIQTYLGKAYLGVTGASALPAAPTASDGLYPVAPAASAVEAVYQFLYNTNVWRQNIYTAIVGGGSDNNSLSAWLQAVYNAANASDIPSNIATTIFNGQANQVTGETVPIQTNAGTKSSTPIWETALTYAIGEGLAQAALAEFGPVGYGLTEGAMYLCLGFESLGNQSTAPSVSPAYVSFTPVINESLSYASLNQLATSIVNGQSTPFSSYATTVTSTSYLQSIFSNYGLLRAMSAMTATPLNDTTMASTTALDNPLTQTSWQAMVPATFTWQQVPSYGFPSANMASGSYNAAVAMPNTTSYSATGVANVISADFNNDGIPDAALSNNASSTVSIMLGVTDPVPTYNQSVRFSSSSGSTLNTNNLTQCSGIAAGDFNNDGFQDILVNSYNQSETGLAFGDGTGSFSSFTGINLAGGSQPEGVVVADFNNDGWLDFAVAAHGSSTIVVGINTTGGKTSTSYTAIASHSTSISTSLNHSTYKASFTTYDINTEGATGGAALDVGDFNNDGNMDIVLSGAGSSTLGLLMNAGFTGSTWDGFETTQNLGLSGLDYLGDLAVGDFNGDGNQDVALVATYGNYKLQPVPASMGGNGSTNFYYGNSVWFLEGSGTASASSSGFATPQWMGLSGLYGAGGPTATDITNLVIETIPARLIGTTWDGFALPNLNGAALVFNPMAEMKQFQTNPSNYGPMISNFLNGGSQIPLNTGCTAFTVPATLPSQGSYSGVSMAIASNGMVLLGLATENSKSTNQTSQLGYSQGNLVNTLATYAPGQDGSTSLLNLTGQVTATTALGTLQGGSVTTLPNGFPSASAYVAGTTNLVIDTQIASPGFFLSWTPATVSGTLNGTNQSTTGGIMTGWNLVDANGTPIALSTLNTLFGTPALSNNQPAIVPNLWTGTTLTPVDPAKPVMAYNGGWFYNSKAANNAPATWAGTFFNWGTSVPGFSPGQLVPANASSVTIPGASYPYSINYSGATTSPAALDSAIAASPTASVAARVSAPLREGRTEGSSLVPPAQPVSGAQRSQQYSRLLRR